MKYDHKKIEAKWQKRWAKAKLYSPDLDTAKKPFYNLMMFPYPSAAGLHIGHVYTFAGADAFGRFMRRQGYDVFEPMGFDAFGIHAENYALKANTHPKRLIAQTTRFFRDEQLAKLGAMFDWSREVDTTKPEYYKWNQWLFLQLYKNGLAERKKAPVNWCPSCATVLADEQAAGGRCERCGTAVERRMLEQWFFKITKYAEALHKNLATIDWSENVKRLQENWIGRSEGAIVDFWVPALKKTLNVFTTRPDTIFGVTYIALSPEHPMAEALVTKAHQPKVSEFLSANEIRRTANAPTAEKFGVFTGSTALNPLSGAAVPIWIADYVLPHYGGGAVMGVPAHDSRDFAFAEKYSLPVIKVVVPEALQHVVRNLEDIAAGAASAIRVESECWEGEGTLVNSADFTGMASPKARQAVIDRLQAKKLGAKHITYRLRDWLISRQRYWGTPIPVVYCSKCGTVPVPDKNLPVLLPDTENFRPSGTGQSPLAAIDSFLHTRCPKCNGEARRETDVMDNFVDSSWYFLRYTSTEFNDRPFDAKRIAKWLPVDMYIGGAEHAVLHLMYTRFIALALHDLKYLPFSDPFKKFRAHGLITKDNAKMSKSKGNVVNPDEYFAKYGADVMRLYMLFIGPFDQGGDFSDKGIKGAVRFIERIWKIGSVARSAKRIALSPERLHMMHKTIAAVTDDFSNLKFNTAIARLMEYVNFLQSQKVIAAAERDTLVGLVAPLAPHAAEELFQMTRKGAKVFKSIHDSPWPKYDKKYIAFDTITLAVQVNGKLRDALAVEAGLSQTRAEKTAQASEKVAKHLAGKTVVKVIHIPDRLINFVVE